jgi:hypothetical protein
MKRRRRFLDGFYVLVREMIQYPVRGFLSSCKFGLVQNDGVQNQWAAAIRHEKMPAWYF